MPFLPVADDNPLRFIPFQVVTAILIALSVAVWLWQGLLPEQEQWDIWLGLGMIPAVLTGEARLPADLYRVPAWATLVTSLFLHADFWHLGGNMLFLWVFGDNVEDATGHVAFVVLFVACGVVGGLAETFVAPGSTTPIVGASGAIAGVLGAYLVLHPRRRLLVLVAKVLPLRLHVGIVLVVWIAYQLVAGLMFGADPENDVAWWAHVAGFVTGMGLIVPLRRHGVPLWDRGS